MTEICHFFYFKNYIIAFRKINFGDINKQKTSENHNMKNENYIRDYQAFFEDKINAIFEQKECVDDSTLFLESFEIYINWLLEC